MIEFLDFEIYAVLPKETIEMLIFSLLAVTCVVLFVTFNVRVTFFAVIIVILVIVYMTAICHYWSLTMNNVFAVNLSLALGISIDYAVHIAHRYLVVVPPDHLISNKERRDFKVAKAIS